LFSKFKRNTKAIFVDPNDTTQIKLVKGERLNIILSPAFYWVKKVSLPLKRVREVKKLLPSIFEDFLPDGSYSYTAYKQEDKFILFAYEDKKILDYLSSKGISSANIHGVYFAQSEFEESEEAYSISERESIINKDGLVVLVPSTWVQESKPLHLQERSLSKHSITLQQFGHIVDTKSLYTIASILGVLALILIVEIFIASAKRDAVLVAKEELFSKYKLQSTMFQNRAIHTKYMDIHKRQTHLREYLSCFLNMHLKPIQKIQSIEVKNKTLFVKFSATAKGSEHEILSQLDSKKFKYKTSFQNDTMKVEMKL